jgi:hypothetical protein
VQRAQSTTKERLKCTRFRARLCMQKNAQTCANIPCHYTLLTTLQYASTQRETPHRHTRQFMAGWRACDDDVSQGSCVTMHRPKRAGEGEAHTSTCRSRSKAHSCARCAMAPRKSHLTAPFSVQSCGCVVQGLWGLCVLTIVSACVSTSEYDRG